MKSGRFLGTALGIFAAAILAVPAFADLSDNLGALTAANAKGYLGPMPEALSATLNSGVFQTGNVPKHTFNFSFGARVMGIHFSDDDRTYTPTAPEGFTPTETVSAPTVIGDTHAVAQGGQGGTTLYHPGGFDLSNFAIAVPQVSIGSLFGTRAVVRWISVDLGDSELGKLDYIGYGAQHSLSQYLPGFPVDLAAGFFAQSLKIGDDKLVKADAIHFDVTASKRVSFLEPWASLGWDTLDMDANYQSTSTPGDAIHVKFDKKSNAHLTLGAQALLGFTRLSASYDIAAQTGATLGLAIGRY